MRPCGCVAMWLCGYVAMWQCGYVAMCLCDHVAMWLCGYVAMSLCGYVVMWLREICHCVARWVVPIPQLLDAYECPSPIFINTMSLQDKNMKASASGPLNHHSWKQKSKENHNTICLFINYTVLGCLVLAPPESLEGCTLQVEKKTHRMPY